MGLLLLSEFSSIPSLKLKIESRRQQKERYTPSFSEWGVVNGVSVNRGSGGFRSESGFSRSYR